MTGDMGLRPELALWSGIPRLAFLPEMTVTETSNAMKEKYPRKRNEEITDERVGGREYFISRLKNSFLRLLVSVFL